jgi:hypothetical protein
VVSSASASERSWREAGHTCWAAPSSRAHNPGKVPDLSANWFAEAPGERRLHNLRKVALLRRELDDGEGGALRIHQHRHAALRDIHGGRQHASTHLLSLGDRGVGICHRKVHQPV